MTESLHIVCWNVDHGSAVFVKTPNNRTLVLDAGSTPNFSPSKHLKYEWKYDHIDEFILSHADSDHITDLELLDTELNPTIFRRNKTVPEKIIYPTFPPQINPLKYYYAFNNRYSSPIEPDHPLQHDPATNWGNVRISNYFNTYPEKNFSNLNDYSLVTVICYGNLEFLFPGDLEAPGFTELLNEISFTKKCTPSSSNSNEIRILVASHHGRKAGVYEPFIDLYSPHLTIMQDQYVNETNDYDAYYVGTSGYPVYDKDTKKTDTRFIVTTKLNDYIHIIADENNVDVHI